MHCMMISTLVQHFLELGSQTKLYPKTNQVWSSTQKDDKLSV